MITLKRVYCSFMPPCVIMQYWVEEKYSSSIRTRSNGSKSILDSHHFQVLSSLHMHHSHAQCWSQWASIAMILHPQCDWHWQPISQNACFTLLWNQILLMKPSTKCYLMLHHHSPPPPPSTPPLYNLFVFSTVSGIALVTHFLSLSILIWWASKFPCNLRLRGRLFQTNFLLTDSGCFDFSDVV